MISVTGPRLVYLWLRRKGLTDVPLMTILKLVVAVLVVTALLAIFVPAMFRALGFGCKIVQKAVSNIPVVGTLADWLGIGSC